MGLPAIGAVVKDVLVSRSPTGDDLILFVDGTSCRVRKEPPETLKMECTSKQFKDYILSPQPPSWNEKVWNDFKDK